MGGPTLTLVIVATNTPATDWGFAWFGLAAVLLGGVLGGGSNLLVARLNKRANAEAERQRHKVEVRRAARLIDDDIETAAAAGRYAVDAKEWWGSGHELTSQGWHQYRDVLAPELSKIDWKSVRIAVMAIGHLQEQRDGAVGIHRMEMATDPTTAGIVATAKAFDLNVYQTAPMSDATATVVEKLLEGFEFGRAALAPLTQDKTET